MFPRSRLAFVLLSYCCLALSAVRAELPKPADSTAAAIPAPLDPELLRFRCDGQSVLAILPGAPGQPEEIIGSLALPGTKVAALRIGKTLYLALDTAEVVAVDISEPHQLVELFRLHGDHVIELKLLGDDVLSMLKWDGSRAYFDVLDPRHPVPIPGPTVKRRAASAQQGGPPIRRFYVLPTLFGPIVPGLILDLGGDYSRDSGLWIGGNLTMSDTLDSARIPDASFWGLIGYSHKYVSAGLMLGGQFGDPSFVSNRGNNKIFGGLVGLAFRFGRITGTHARVSVAFSFVGFFPVTIPWVDTSLHVRLHPRVFGLLRGRGGFSLPLFFTATGEVGAEIAVGPQLRRDLLIASVGGGAVASLPAGTLQLGYERRW